MSPFVGASHQEFTNVADAANEDQVAPITSARKMPAFFCSNFNVHMLLRVIFFLLGIGILIPWNAFISAISYFESRLCTDEFKDKRGSLESTFSIVYNVSSVLSLGLLLLAQWVADQRLAAQEALEEQITGGLSSLSPTHCTSTTPTAKSAPNRGSDRQHSHVSHRSSSSSAGSSATGHSFWLVMVPLSVYFVVFLGQAVAVWWTHLDPTVFYVWTMTSLALCGICGALASSGIVATAGLFLPDIGIEPYIAGQPAGGLIVSVANLIAARYEDPMDFWNSRCAGDNEDHRDGSSGKEVDSNLDLVRRLEENTAKCSPYTDIDHAVLTYFLMGSFVLAACIAGFAYIDMYQQRQHRDDYETVQDVGGDDVDITTPLGRDAEDPLATLAQSPYGVEMNSTLLLQRDPDSSGLSEEEEEEIGGDSARLPQNLDLHTTVHRGMVDTRMSFGHDAVLDSHHESENETNEVWSIVRTPAISIWLVFFVTLALFPGWVSRLRSVRQCTIFNNRWVNDLYTPLTFVVYNSGDLVGRILAVYLPLSKMHHVSAKLVTGSLVRFGLFPLFYFCVSRHHGATKWTIDSDLYSFAVQVLFSVSNGFVTTAAFVHAPSLLPNVTHVQERSAEILNLALYMGLLTGSLFSVPLLSLFAG